MCLAGSESVCYKPRRKSFASNGERGLRSQPRARGTLRQLIILLRHQDAGRSPLMRGKIGPGR
jgi:hypothetical protein